MDEKLLREMDENWLLVRELAATEKRNAADVARLLRRVIEDESFSTMLDVPQTVVRSVVKEVENSPLAPVSTIEVPATAESFQVDARFVRNVGAMARVVKIYDASGNFESWFGNMMVDAHPGSTLACHVLTRDAYDREILSALGGESKCETTLAELWQLLLLQRDGEAGTLLTNGCANIFYVRDSSSALRAVGVRWSGGGWYVYAIELGYGFWNYGRRVFVRNS